MDTTNLDKTIGHCYGDGLGEIASQAQAELNALNKIAETLNTVKDKVLGQDGDRSNEALLRWIEHTIERETQFSDPNPNAETLYSKGHSPLPWRAENTPRGEWFIIADGGDTEIVVATTEDDVLANAEADAAFIIKACNSHDALVSALTALADEAFMHMIGGRGDLIDNARAAIAKATQSAE